MRYYGDASLVGPANPVGGSDAGVRSGHLFSGPESRNPSVKCPVTTYIVAPSGLLRTE